MLAKKFRLSRQQINLIYKKGRSKSFGDLGVKFLTNAQTFPRFAIVISQKVVKKASERNRLRRVIYDELGRRLKDWPEGQNFDYLVRLFKAPKDEKKLRQCLNFWR